MKENSIIGIGKVAKVFKLKDKAIKSFNEDYHEAWIENEAMIQKMIYNETQLNVPNCTYERGSHQIKMTLVNGKTLADRMRQEKYQDGLNDLIDLQLSIHQYKNLSLEQAEGTFKTMITESKLQEEVKIKVLNILENLEPKASLCHFDFHFLNIMFDGNEYVIIDWANAKIGNPILDIGRTYVILKQYAKRLAEKYLKDICKQGNYEINAIKEIIPVMAALRLLESDSEMFSEVLYDLILKN